MSTKYLDNTGLAYFWGKIKSWVISRGYITSSGSITGNAATATKVVGTAANDTVAELVRGTMGSNDAFHIAIGGGNNAGYAEIATADDYSEPIYVRQYQGGFATLKRTATLLDGSGNTSFPGTLTAARFNSPLSIYKVDSTNTDVSANNVPIGLRGLSRQARSCKTAFTPAANVTVEYSIDGGTTWLDYGATNAQKQALFAMQHGANFQIGKGTAGGTSAVSTDCKLRVTVAPADRYATVDCVYLWVCAYNHTMKVDIETSTIGAKTTFSAFRTGVGISGWAGANFISFDRTKYGGGSTQTSNRYAYRFTFYCTAIGANAGYPDVRDIRIYGPFSHTSANSMMGYDSLYSWDVDQNASFPANVSAVKFTGVLAGNVTGNVTGNCSGTAANVTGTVAIDHGGTGATTRLDAVKALTNEDVGTSATHFLTITTNWGKAGFTRVADVKTVLGLKSAAYTESSAYAAASHGTHVTFPSSGTPANIGTASNGTASTVARSDHVHALPDSGVTAGRYTSVNVDAKGRVTAGNVKHSYTTAANATRNWYRIANANTHQINADTPLHLQFFVRAQASAAGVGYWESWFVDLEVWGQNAGCRVFGNASAPFSQICVRYENTAASVTTSTAPAVDIYLNYVIAGGTVLEIEEVYNSGWTFVADGALAVSTVPSGYETKGGIGVNGNGVNYATNATYADRTQLQRSDITANITLADNDTYRGRVLNVTGTRTVTVPSLNSGWAWFLIKNNNASSGTVTLHPSTTSVLIDNSNADIVLQPKEYIRIASRAANSYVIVEDGRWMSQKADKATTIAGYGITDAKIANGVITLGSSTITPLTSHQSLTNYATLNTAQTFSANKTFSSGITLSGGEFLRSNTTGNLTFRGGTGGNTGGALSLCGESSSGNEGRFFLNARTSSAQKALTGSPNGTLTWNGQTIQTSSDERLKTPLSTVPDEVLDAWGDVRWGEFKFLDAVDRKGDSARLHLGLIAQRVKASFESRGLDACSYGILCHEVRPATEETPAVDLWMVRYTEALAMEAAFQRRRADRLEARISALEERLNV